jgi:hypothetical protein
MFPEGFGGTYINLYFKIAKKNIGWVKHDVNVN